MDSEHDDSRDEEDLVDDFDQDLSVDEEETGSTGIDMFVARSPHSASHTSDSRDYPQDSQSADDGSSELIHYSGTSPATSSHYSSSPIHSGSAYGDDSNPYSQESKSPLVEDESDDTGME